MKELAKPLNDNTLERAVESIASYPSKAALEAVTLYLKHPSPQVANRAQMTLATIRRELGSR